MIIKSHCPACLSTDIEKALAAIDHTVSHETFEIFRCNQCGFHFTNSIPEENVIGNYYQSEEYISHTNTSKGFINRVYQIIRNYTLKSKRKLIQKFTQKKKGRLLDIGCGTGNFLNTMQVVGWEITGIEPSSQAREQAKKNFGIDPFEPGHLYSLSEKSFDAITLWHVLEHVYDLDGYLAKIRSVLAPQGKAFIAVPNPGSFDAKKYGPLWAAWDVPRHLYHFHPAAMETLLTRMGFSIVEIKRMPFDSFYVSMLSEKYRKGGILRGIWIGFRSWLIALFNKSRCSSIIYIVQPSK